MSSLSPVIMIASLFILVGFMVLITYMPILQATITFVICIALGAAVAALNR